MGPMLEHHAPHWSTRLEEPSTGSCSVSPTLRIEYACLTLRGFYPYENDRENQDSFASLPNAKVGQTPHPMFAVFDGHGPLGDHVSRLSRDQLPAAIIAEAVVSLHSI